MRPRDASGWLKFEGKLFVGTLIGYVAIAAVTGILTVEVLVTGPDEVSQAECVVVFPVMGWEDGHDDEATQTYP